MKRMPSVLVLGLCLTALSSVAQYSIDWSTIDGGGQMFSTGGGYINADAIDPSFKDSNPFVALLSRG